MQEIKHHLNGHFIQLNDIDASGTANWNDGKGFEPIGRSSQQAFIGSYDGGGFSIENLTINRPDEDGVGLFGFVGESLLRNLKMTNVTIIGKARVGGLIGVGHSSNYFKLEVVSTIKGTSNIGGLVGDFFGNMEQCITQTSLVGEESMGGLFGTGGGTITQCASLGQISGGNNIGGLVGVGGHLAIFDSYSSVKIVGDSDCGGLIGELINITEFDTGSIKNAYFSGELLTKQASGAIFGKNGICLFLKGVYWDEKVGANIGHQFEGSCIDHDYPNLSEVQFITNLRTEQMNGQQAYSNMYEFDFETVWQLAENYPVLKWQNHPNSVEAPDVAILRVQYTKLKFNDIEVSESEYVEFAISNSGKIPLNIELSLTGEHASNFELIYSHEQTSIQVHDTLQIKIACKPKQIGELKGQLLITHNGANFESPIQVLLEGNGIEKTAIESNNEIPQNVELFQNYPNPFNPSTQIRFSLPKSSSVELSVFDMQGRLVHVLVKKELATGLHTVEWNSQNKQASGVYVFQLQAGTEIRLIKSLLIK